MKPLCRFIASPLRPTKRPPSPSAYIEPPIKHRSTVTDVNRFIMPPLSVDQPLPSNFIASHDPAIQVTRRARRSVRPKIRQEVQKLKKVCAPAPDNFQIGFDDAGRFGDWSEDRSLVKAQDSINWSITMCDLEKLKLDILHCYWELLLNSLNSVVRVTQRLYVLQDWNYKGHLVV